MSVLYCRNCGAKIEYTLQKPIACYKCNKDLSVASLPKIKTERKEEGENIRSRRNSRDIKNIKISTSEDGLYPVYKF